MEVNRIGLCTLYHKVYSSEMLNDFSFWLPAMQQRKKRFYCAPDFGGFKDQKLPFFHLAWLKTASLRKSPTFDQSFAVLEDRLTQQLGV